MPQPQAFLARGFAVGVGLRRMIGKAQRRRLRAIIHLVPDGEALRLLRIGMGLARGRRQKAEREGK